MKKTSYAYLCLKPTVSKITHESGKFATIIIVNCMYSARMESLIAELANSQLSALYRKKKSHI